jgi:hypothetical protein
MNKSRLISLIAITTFAAASVAAHAHGGGGARAGGDFGGLSTSHISTEGLRNTNGPDAHDRDKGRTRSEDRAEMRGGDRHGKSHPQHSKR